MPSGRTLSREKDEMNYKRKRRRKKNAKTTTTTFAHGGAES